MQGSSCRLHQRLTFTGKLSAAYLSTEKKACISLITTTASDFKYESSRFKFKVSGLALLPSSSAQHERYMYLCQFLFPSFLLIKRASFALSQAVSSSHLPIPLQKSKTSLWSAFVGSSARRIDLIIWSVQFWDGLVGDLHRGHSPETPEKNQRCCSPPWGTPGGWTTHRAVSQQCPQWPTHNARSLPSP